MRTALLLVLCSYAMAAEPTFQDGYRAGLTLGSLQGQSRQTETLRELVKAIDDPKLKAPLTGMFAESLADYFRLYDEAKALNEKFALVDPVAWTEGHARIRGKFIQAAKMIPLDTIGNPATKAVIEQNLAP